MKKTLLFCILLLMALSCQDIVQVSPPENLIERDQMEDIIFDVAMVNAARGFNVQRLKSNKISPDSYVFDKHNIDSLQYAQSTVYYAADSEDYKSMYRNVQTRLDTLYKRLQAEEALFQKKKDSVRTAEVLAKRKLDSIKKSKGDTLNTPKVLRQRPTLSSSSQI